MCHSVQNGIVALRDWVERTARQLPTDTFTLGSSTMINGPAASVGVGAPTHKVSLRNLSALVMTETELKVIAALAIIGLSSSPMNG